MSGFGPRLALVALIMLPSLARAETLLTVVASDIVDQKAVFATVESPNVVPARARIGGTVIALAVRDGDAVTPGQTIAVIGDDKLALQLGALDAQIAGLRSQVAQAQTDLGRADALFQKGAGPKATLDQARTTLEVATATLRARTAERSVLQQNMAEGAVLAPVAGRVLNVPVTTGSVVLPGDGVAQIAQQGFKLRLRVPEQHAASLKAGDPVRLDAGQLGVPAALAGRITLVYPQIAEGRVVADAEVAGVGDYFVGERLRVWISAGSRSGVVVPAGFVGTRFGLDHVRLRRDNTTVEIPVQRGQVRADGVELLSGVRAGDVLVAP
jgi:RND family efflux transporter MFP subunit